MGSDQKDLYLELIKKNIEPKEAARLAGYKEGYIPEDRPSKRITKALRKRGITDDTIANTVAEGLEAKTRFDTPDHNARTKYLSLLSKWLGYEKDAINVIIGLNNAGQVVDPDKLNEAIQILEAEIVSRQESVSIDSKAPTMPQDESLPPKLDLGPNEGSKGL